MAFLSNTHPTSRHAPFTQISVMDMLSVYRQRRALAKLDARVLDDLGITREEADLESRRPFWDLPAK